MVFVRFNLDFLYTTITMGVDPGYVKENFYDKVNTMQVFAMVSMNKDSKLPPEKNSLSKEIHKLEMKHFPVTIEKLLNNFNNG